MSGPGALGDYLGKVFSGHNRAVSISCTILVQTQAREQASTEKRDRLENITPTWKNVYN